MISPFQNIRDSLTGKAIAVRVAGVAHFRVFLRVFQQPLEIPINRFLIGAHQLQGTGGDAFRALGGIPHDQHGLAQGGDFLVKYFLLLRNNSSDRSKLISPYVWTVFVTMPFQIQKI